MFSIILVARRWICSIFLVETLVFGLYALEQYSKMGLTNGLIMTFSMPIFKRENVCIIIPTFLLVLAHILVTCL